MFQDVYRKCLQKKKERLIYFVVHEDSKHVGIHVRLIDDRLRSPPQVFHS